MTVGDIAEHFRRCRKNDERPAVPGPIFPPRAKKPVFQATRIVEWIMRKRTFALGISTCLALSFVALPAAADAGKTEAVHPSGSTVQPRAEFVWLVSKNADRYDVEIRDRNGTVLQAQTFTAAGAKCSQKKNQVCRVLFDGAVELKAASWRVRGVDGAKKGPFSEPAYFIVEDDGPVWAVVNADGSLARGAGVETVSAQGGGSYAITFVKDVAACAYTGTVGLSGDTDSAPDGAVTVVGLTGVPNGVYVRTFNQAGTATNSGFHLVVTCAVGVLLPPT